MAHTGDAVIMEKTLATTTLSEFRIQGLGFRGFLLSLLTACFSGLKASPLRGSGSSWLEIEALGRYHVRGPPFEEQPM